MSRLSDKFANGEFVVTTELTPPKGIDLDELLEKAASLTNLVDAFNLTDSHASKMSLSPIAAAMQLMANGHEPILQLTTRDRNRIGLQSDMLGAGLLGIENLVCMGGDPPQLGDHPDAKPVFDLSTSELIKAAHQLSQGQDMMGNKLSGVPTFHVGAVVNPGVDDLDTEIERLEEKVSAGARFFQTQAIYDVEVFIHFMDRISHLDIHVLAGILPIKSVKMARYMNEKIPGIHIPEHLINTISHAKDVESASATIAANTIKEIGNRCAGLHLMAVGSEKLIPRILELA